MSVVTGSLDYSWINGKPGNLVLDNSAPTTVIHRESAGTYALSLSPTNQRVSNIWGTTADTYSTSKLRTIQMGQQMLTNIPVVVASEAVWLTQTQLLGPRRDMDQIADAVRKIKQHSL